jgi:cysteinyl-tRNA synthetase
MKATDYIKDQIELVEILEEKGFTYETEDGIYFDTTKFPNYNRLSKQNVEDQKAGARVEIKGKKHISDFALWKFSPIDHKRQMEWDSPWGKGFPGWHLECSAMSMREFGPTLDIHTGGIDHINIHHTNEIAQSEAATGKEFVRYWVHYAWLLVNGKKMSKSLKNFYTVQEIIEKGYDPIALRYLYLQTHYRQEMNFTFEALQAAQTALSRLRTEFAELGKPNEEFLEIEGSFYDALNDDLNTPKALAVVWELLNSKEKPGAKSAAILKFDKILGLNLDKIELKEKKERKIEIPNEVYELVKKRKALRAQAKYHLADQVRHKIRKFGFDIEDKKKGETIIKPLEKKEL